MCVHACACSCACACACARASVLLALLRWKLLALTGYENNNAHMDRLVKFRKLGTQI